MCVSILAAHFVSLFEIIFNVLMTKQVVWDTSTAPIYTGDFIT